VDAFPKNPRRHLIFDGFRLDLQPCCDFADCQYSSIIRVWPSFTADGKTMYFNCQVRPDRAGKVACKLIV
jgi:hypothetical protein